MKNTTGVAEMNLLFLNHYAGSKTYGMEFRTYYFAKKLNRIGFNITIVAADFSHLRKINPKISKDFEESYIDQIKFCWVKTREYKGNGMSRVLNMFQYALKLAINARKIMHRYRPNVIIASSPHPLTWLSSYFIAKRYNAKFIAETRDLWPETLVAMGKINRNSIPAKILYKLEKFIYKKADKLIFTFPGGKDYVESIGLDTSKVRYINNGVDLEEYNENKTTNILKDEDLDNIEKFKVLYTGAMGQANALDYLIKAARIIRDKGIENIQFILLGNGYQRKELEEYVKSNNITNVVFKDKVEKKYIPNILSKSNLNIITGKHIYLYKYGLSPNKLFEYFASGKPTLSNIECEYDILEEYKCGITVKGGSAEALVEGILKFYNMSKEEYDTYCGNALKAAQDFDFKILTDKLEKVILED